MTEPNLLELAAQAIADRAVGSPRVWNICIVDGKIKCLRNEEIPESSETLYCFTDLAARKGLSGKQWDDLFTALRTYVNRRPGCLKTQKP